MGLDDGMFQVSVMDTGDVELVTWYDKISYRNEMNGETVQESAVIVVDSISDFARQIEETEVSCVKLLISRMSLSCVDHGER